MGQEVHSLDAIINDAQSDIDKTLDDALQGLSNAECADVVSAVMDELGIRLEMHDGED